MCFSYINGSFVYILLLVYVTLIYIFFYMCILPSVYISLYLYIYDFYICLLLLYIPPIGISLTLYIYCYTYGLILQLSFVTTNHYKGSF